MVRKHFDQHMQKESSVSVSRSLSSLIVKSAQYGALPFAYRGRFWLLFRHLFTRRALLHELVRLNEYRRWFQKMGIRTVLDVGGYIGAFAYAMRMMLPQAQIYSFEPLEANYRTLVRNLQPFGHFQAFQTALGDSVGRLEFYQNDFLASSSALAMTELHRRAFPHTGHQVRVSVPLARLDDYLDTMSLQPPVLLKVDVQGYEAAVLRGAAHTLTQVDFLICEVSFVELYAGQPLFDDLYAMLKEHGFRFAGLLDVLLSPLDDVILQGDALFLRNGKAEPA
jgi:FkbM family methyltransferase